jgi:hypothetical protein
MERVLFGDNQFFAINHVSEDKARAQAMRFQDIGEVIKVLDDAYDCGIHVFMCTTHDRIAEICDHVRGNPNRYPDLKFYPCMPYAHKYANAVTEFGMIDALRRFLPDEGALGALLRGGMSVATKDVEGIMRLLIDAEMKMFHGLPTPVIFLQNVVTDLLLGLGAVTSYGLFAEHVRSAYGAEPGFITMNLPRLLDALEKVGVDNPIVCANINKVGFRMCGGLKAYEEAIANRRFRPIAMSVLASGAIAPREAVEYVCGLDRVQAIVFGASSRKNIQEMKRLIDELSVAA